MVNAPCIHCGEPHPPSTAFCPNTGKPLGAARGDGPLSSALPAPPTAATGGHSGAVPVATDTGRSSGRKSLPSWVAEPQGPATNTPGEVEVDDSGATGVLDLLGRSVELYKKHAQVLITVAAVVFVPGALAHACAQAAILAPTMAVAVTVDPVTHLPTTAPLAGASIVAGFTMVLLGLLASAVTGLFLHGIVVPLAHGALALTTADRITGGAAGWRDIWTWLFRRLGVVLSAVIPAALLTGVGFFFLVIPGVVLAFFFAFVPTIALFEGIGGTAALRRSYRLVRSDWLRVLLILVVFAVISAIARFLAGLLTSGLFGSYLLQDVLTLVAMPIPVVGSVLLYFDVRRKFDADGFSEQKLADEMQTLRTG